MPRWGCVETDLSALPRINCAAVESHTRWLSPIVSPLLLLLLLLSVPRLIIFQLCVDIEIERTTKYTRCDESLSDLSRLAGGWQVSSSLCNVHRRHQLDSALSLSLLPLEMSLQFSTPLSSSIVARPVLPFSFFPSRSQACFVFLSIQLVILSLSFALARLAVPSPSNLELYLGDGGPNRPLVRANEHLNAPKSVAVANSTHSLSLFSVLR